MSQNIFIKKFLLSIFIFSIFINFAFAGTKGAGESCKVLSGGNDNSECISGYSCQGGSGIGTTGTCTVIPSPTPNTQNTSIPQATVTDFSDIGGLLTNFNKNILQNLVVVLSGAALVVFLWGLVKFIYDRADGNTDKIAKDKEAMLWGLGALFILVSVWGIIKMFQGFLGISSNNDVNIPRICVNGSCNTGSIQSSNGGGISQGGGVFNDSSQGLLDGSYDVNSIRGWSIPIKKGSKGKDVAELQQFLKNNGYDIGSTGVDADFGSNTENTVKAFQQKNSLVADGQVGHATKAVILYKYMNASAGVDTYNVKSWHNVFTYGTGDANNQDDSVLYLQQFLVDNGYALPKYGVDGIWRAETRSAVLKFQGDKFLIQDDKVGPSTQAVILYISNGNQ